MPHQAIICEQTAANGNAGSRATFATQLAHARQRWLLVELCMCEPLMITPLGQDEHPHFKRPPLQGWLLRCYGIAVSWLKKNEAKRMRQRRQRDDLDAERTRDVGGAGCSTC